MAKYTDVDLHIDIVEGQMSDGGLAVLYWFAGPGREALNRLEVDSSPEPINNALAQACRALWGKSPAECYALAIFCEDEVLNHAIQAIMEDWG